MQKVFNKVCRIEICCLYLHIILKPKVMNGTLNQFLNIGDTVLWSGSFGGDSPELVRVLSIEVCAQGQKYGSEVDAVNWRNVDRRVVVNLDNGHWAYGTQLAQRI